MIMRRAYWVVTIGLAGALLVAGLTYKQWPQLFRRAAPQKPAADQNEPSALPPFSTREPERYQGTRVITSIETVNGATAAPVTSTVVIARDGSKRREEYQTAAGATLVYLETPDGRFVLQSAEKLYASLSLTVGLPDAGDNQDDSSSASPESLLNETRLASRYETLGAESLHGRATRKYRVTASDAANGNAVSSVTIIWIDDVLGMPIRSDSSSTGSDRTTKVIMELRDIKLDVDPQIFVIPADYKKVDSLPTKH